MLHQDDASSVAARVKKTDGREIESFYKQYYEKYVKALDQGEKADRYLVKHICNFWRTIKIKFYRKWKFDWHLLLIVFITRAQLGKAYQVAGVLFEVLCAVNKSEKAEEVPADVSSRLFIILVILWFCSLHNISDVCTHRSLHQLERLRQSRLYMHPTTFCLLILPVNHNASCSLRRYPSYWF